MTRFVLALVMATTFVAGSPDVVDGVPSIANPVQIVQPIHGIQDMLELSVMVRIGDRGNGSGVLFTRVEGGAIKTYVLTAGHVARAAERMSDGIVTVRAEYRERGKIVGEAECDAEIVVLEEGAADHGSGRPDLALFRVLQDNFRPLTACAVLHTGGIPGIGTEVCHVGCTRGLYNSYSEGVISQTDVTFAGENVDQTSSMAYPGSSGGGVWLKDTGKLYGILVMGIGPGVNFIVPARHILAWADRNGVEWLWRNPSLMMDPR